MKKRTMLVGPRNSGKIVIAQHLEASAEPLRRVANIVYREKTITVPDSYLESPWMHKHIISLQQSAKCGLFIHPLEASHNSYPPNFAKAFRIPLFGIITYHESFTQAERNTASRFLLDSGITEISLLIDLEEELELAKIKELCN